MNAEPSVEDLENCYRTVIKELPWIRPEAVSLFARIHAARWNERPVFCRLVKDYPDLKRAIATPEAARRPDGIFDVLMTVVMQLFHHANEQRNVIQQLREWGVGDSHEGLLNANFNCCLPAQRMHLEIVPAKVYLEMPLKECGQAVCRCTFIMNRRRDYSRYLR